MKKISKTGAREHIEKFFSDVKNKTPKQVKKIKRLAMSQSIPLKEKRKLFCKKCLTTYKNPKTRIRNKMRLITCGNCGHIARWRI